MKQILRRTIRDEALVGLLELIIDSGRDVLTDEAPQHWFQGDSLLDALRPKGLPIGNLTSQFFANVLLDPIDHFIAGHPQSRGCVRYADDLLIFGDTKPALWSVCDALSRELEGLRLKLHPGKTHVCRSTDGVPFLGLKLTGHGRRLTQSLIRRFNRRRRGLQFEFAHRQTGLHDVRQSLHAWLAYARTANSAGLCRDLLRHTVLKRGTPCQRGRSLSDGGLD